MINILILNNIISNKRPLHSTNVNNQNQHESMNSHRNNYLSNDPMINSVVININNAHKKGEAFHV